MKNYPVESIVQEAFEAARDAALDFEKSNGDQMWPCGFAWVNIQPANCRLANHLKKYKLGRKSYHKGLDVWNPSGHPTQNMDIKAAGAEAFAQVLRKHGIKAYSESRMD